MADIKWRTASVREALGHARGRTIEDGQWGAGEHVTWFTDGTAVRLTTETCHGSEWTGSWTEEDFEIGEPHSLVQEKP